MIKTYGGSAQQQQLEYLHKRYIQTESFSFQDHFNILHIFHSDWRPVLTFKLSDSLLSSVTTILSQNGLTILYISFFIFSNCVWKVCIGLSLKEMKTWETNNWKTTSEETCTHIVPGYLYYNTVTTVAGLDKGFCKICIGYFVREDILGWW